jgi:hypothetical protein
MEVALEELGVTADKATILRDQRFMNALMEVGRHSAAAIEIFPTPPESSRTLTPLREVRLVRANR